MMRILVDENIPSMTVAALRAAGHDVVDLRGTPDEGSADSTVWNRCLTERRLLITTDRGFIHPGTEQHHGILAVCLRQPNRLRIHARVLEGLAQLPESAWVGAVMLVRDTTIQVWNPATP